MNTFVFFIFFIANILFITYIIEKYTITKFVYKTFLFFIASLFFSKLILNNINYSQTKGDKIIMLFIFVVLVINLVRFLNKSYELSVFIILYPSLIFTFVYSCMSSLSSTYNSKTLLLLFLTAYIIINWTKYGYSSFTNKYCRLFISVLFYVLIMMIIAAIFMPNAILMVPNKVLNNINVHNDKFLLKIFIKSLINNYSLHDITFSSSVTIDFLSIVQYVLAKFVDLIFLGLIFKFIESYFDSKEM